MKWVSASSLSLLTMIGVLLGTTSSADAQVKPPVDVPRTLSPWVGWVMHDRPDLRCSEMPGGSFACNWPGELALTTDDVGATFTYTVWLDAESWVQLPGSEKHWPQEVRDGFATPLVAADGNTPIVRLSAGSHTLTGRFIWNRPPEVMRIPPDTGIIRLTLGDSVTEHPRFDAEGRLFLQAGGEGDGPSSDSLRVSTYRRLHDGVPLTVVTRFELNVSGRAREVELGEVMLSGSRPVTASGGLPLQISPEGQVKVYVKPGTHNVEVQAVITESVEKIAVPARGGDEFDPQEVWVWHPNEEVRSVKVAGLASVDPERTSLPSAWRGSGTVYLAQPGQSLSFEVTRRGEVEAAPNVIHLRRQMWLDLDGDGYTIRDNITGTMHQGWRLNTNNAGNLGRVSAGGDDLLITADPRTDQPGIELRDSQLNLSADSRLEDARGDIGIVGWDADVQHLSAELNLPPGWELLGGRGVDQMQNTWIESWTLFDFFFVLMVALALGKLCGWKWATVAGLALALSHGEPDAPRWVWIQLLATLALVRVVPDNWLRKSVVVYRYVLLIALIVILAPFARDQVRYALHPQVEHGGAGPTQGIGYYSYASKGKFDDFKQEEAPAFEPEPIPTEEQNSVDSEIALAEEEVLQDEAGAFAPAADKPAPVKKAKPKAPKKRLQRTRGKLGNVTRDLLTVSSSDSYTRGGGEWTVQQVDPNAVVQTGPGVPRWQWTRWDLTWTGPVRRDHEIQLWLISPGWNRGITIVRVILLIIMALLLIGRKDMVWVRKPDKDEDNQDDAGTPGKKGRPSFWQSLVGAVLLCSLITVGGGASRAEAQAPPGGSDGFPPQPLLSELKKRLVDEQGCRGPCVIVSRADFVVEGTALLMRAEVHAQRDAGMYLPGPSDPLRVDEVKVDGFVTRELRRDPGGLMAVRLQPGRHIVELRGTLVGRNVVTIQLDERTRPRFVTFTGPQWSVDGIRETGEPDNSIQLTRKGEEADDKSGTELSTELPPWYQVSRHLALGIPWQMRTRVTRADSSRPQLVKLPLVAGEKVITDGLRVENERVLVDFPRGTSEVTYTSELTVAESIPLVAAKDEPWSEFWTVECSRIWSCSFDGVRPVRSVNSGKYRPVWRPWPGEKLTVNVTRPKGTPGQATTIESVRYTVTPGKRLLQAVLEMEIRASQGGFQKVTLPPEAEIQSALIDGQDKNLRAKDSVLNVPVKPGSQRVTLTWQQPWERTFMEKVPPVDIGSKAVNATVEVNLGDDRWLLWVMGPDWGPAILFWSHLIILLVAAVLAGRLKKLPLKTWEWLLLAVGMAQLPVVIMLIPLGWFVALTWRQAAPLDKWWKFDLYQVALVLLTIFAGISLYAAIHSNLLLDIDMQVRGAGSSNSVLSWYDDQIEGPLPTPSLVSLPLLVWRIAMLVWALWLVARLLKWVPWGWRAFAHTGLWRKPPPGPPRPNRRFAMAGGPPPGGGAPPAPGGPPTGGPAPQGGPPPAHGSTPSPDDDGRGSEQEPSTESSPVPTADFERPVVEESDTEEPSPVEEPDPQEQTKSGMPFNPSDIVDSRGTQIGIPAAAIEEEILHQVNQADSGSSRTEILRKLAERARRRTQTQEGDGDEEGNEE